MVLVWSGKAKVPQMLVGIFIGAIFSSLLGPCSSQAAEAPDQRSGGAADFITQHQDDKQETVPWGKILSPILQITVLERVEDGDCYGWSIWMFVTGGRFLHHMQRCRTSTGKLRRLCWGMHLGWLCLIHTVDSESFCGWQRHLWPSRLDVSSGLLLHQGCNMGCTKDIGKIFPSLRLIILASYSHGH